MPTLRVEHAPESLRVFREGLSTPLLTQRAAKDKRPFIHPILSPDGVGELTENEPGHHLWQHGLYVGLNDVNGVGFWTEGLHEKNKEKDGTFHPLPLEAAKAEGARVSWRVITAWRSPKGAPMLTETQAWRFEDFGRHYVLDLDWTLSADTDLTFGKYAYGGLFLRMPVRPDCAGVALNSAGQSNDAAEAQRAKWVSVHLNIPRRESQAQRACGIAMLDHPSNPGHPAPWRVDGQLGIAPSRCIAGPWNLPKGTRTTSRYRLPIFIGPSDATSLNSEWETFAHT